MHCFGLACCGKIRKVPLIVDGEMKIQSVINMTNSADHRFGDAACFLPMQKCFMGYIADPKNFNEKDYKDMPHYKEQ
jgi:pyruvate/2-oxoglutarate dehydrogenase complex dihydrolipoamide acyltransferase (E2) component